MNNIISDWNFEGDLPVTGQKNPTGADHDLVELLWRNGSVFLHSQTHRKQSLINPPMNDPPRQAQTKVHEHNNNQATRPYGASGNNNMALAAHQEDETVSWIHFPMEDSFEKEFCSNFFSELPSSSEAIPLDPTPPKLKTPPRPDHQEGEGQMPPPLSHCGSNQLAPNDLNDVVSWVSSSNGNTTGFSAPPPCFKGQGGREKASIGRRVGPPQSESGKTETVEPTLTSSSGGSGSSFGRGCKQSTTTSGNTNNKRKSRDQVEELECQSEAAELRSAAANKSAQRSGNSRKSRAAEVHNLSERRRRDRINEKMKALQELIPHSNKTDKASMLDEAIEYLKSLQLQLQVMWMGSGMTPMMFPGMQHYMSRMSMAMGPPAMPSMHMPPRVPVVDHQAAAVAPLIVGPTAEQHQQGFNPLNFQNHQMQGASFPDQYARFMGWNPMQQPVNLFRFNPQTVQQGQSIAQQGIMSAGPSSCVGAPIDGSALSGKMG